MTRFHATCSVLLHVTMLCWMLATGALAQDLCDVKIGKVSASVVQPYSWPEYYPYEFQLTATAATGYHFTVGGLGCLYSAVSSQGISLYALSTYTDTSAPVDMYINSPSDGCPPACMQFGMQDFWFLDFFGGVSNKVHFTVDYPGDMLVEDDVTLLPDPTHANVLRRVTYAVGNYYSQIAAANIQIGEDISFSGYNCDQQLTMKTTSCSQPSPSYTTANGLMRDQWGFGGTTAATPAGCGVNVTDHWQVCATQWGGVGQQLPQQTFATLTGYIHSDSIDILGYITPPSSVT